MFENFRKRIPLLFMTLLMSVSISYPYLEFIGSGISIFGTFLIAALLILCVECITLNKWTVCAAGCLAGLHAINSFVEFPLFHEIAQYINACCNDTYWKVFWTDRYMFYSEIATDFIVIFVVCISIHVLYTRIRSAELTGAAIALYVFFMEFYMMGGRTWVMLSMFLGILALAILYGYKWRYVSENAAKKSISLRCGAPLLCILLALTIALTYISDIAANHDLRNFADSSFFGIISNHVPEEIKPRFMQNIFEKSNGTLGGDVLMNNTHLFTVSVSVEDPMAYLSDSSVYLRGIACDNFKNNAWRTDIDNGKDKLLKDYFRSNDYFCADGSEDIIDAWLNSGVYQQRKFTVYYDASRPAVLFNHTYTCDIYMKDTSDKIYYDYSTYTYHKEIGTAYTVEYVGLDRNSASMSSFLQSYGDKTFASDKNISRSLKKTLTDYYLKVPNDISDSVEELAEQITANASGDYHRAAAIESYLKRNYKYTLRPGDVPDGENIVDYFLFGNKQGYCVYFASAMVMLCRSIGIPARYVKGYRVDNVVLNQARSVTAANAHAWVEAWIPDLGWVTFDPVSAASFQSNTEKHTPPPTPPAALPPTPTPTITTPPITTPPVTPTPTPTLTPTPTPTITPTPTTTPLHSDSAHEDKKSDPLLTWWVFGIGGSALLVCAFFVIVLLRRYMRNSLRKNVNDMAAYKAAARIYRAVVFVETFMGTPPGDGETVSEYFNRLNDPEFDKMADVLEKCFYDQAVLTKAQYDSFRELVRSKEQEAMRINGRWKWLRWKLGRGSL